MHRTDAVGGGFDGGVARRAGLALGQRTIGRAESQRQRQRLASVADLRAGVDVEQPDILEQFARPVAHSVDHRPSGDVLADDQADVLEDRRERRHRRSRQRLGERDGRQVKLDRAGALRQAGPLHNGRMQLACVPDD